MKIAYQGIAGSYSESCAKEKYNFAQKYRIDEYVRVYMNAHTYGIEPNIHYDDFDITLIFFFVCKLK